jgi:hypothetical protein
MQLWLATSLPREETTVWSTFFHDCICMARMAKHTHSWTRTGFGPAANFFRSTRICSRKAGSSLSEICVERSYVIFVLLSAWIPYPCILMYAAPSIPCP